MEHLSRDSKNRNHMDQLPNYIRASGQTGQLNPRYVAEMMGFPVNWTELPYQGGGTKA